MEITFVTSYYPPEMGAAANRIKNMAEALSVHYDKVNIITPLPNYPKGEIYKEYKGFFKKLEKKGKINIYRYWIYPSVSRNILKRIFSMLSFALTLWSYFFNFKQIKRSKWVIIQNSPLLVSFSSIILFKFIYKKNVALNVSDLWPLTALELGVVKKGKFYSLLEWIERFNYRNSDLILGQSNEILEHIKEIVDKPNFLYRNLQINNFTNIVGIKPFNDFKIVYAGLLGVAQGVHDIILNINFQKLGIEFHIYGSGNEVEDIQNYIKKNPDSNVKYFGVISKQELLKVLPHYHASIVPLKASIKGAVPSKIFELVKLNIPILLLAKGEAASLIRDWDVGYVSDPQDFNSLLRNIESIFKSENNYRQFAINCQNVSQIELNFDFQIEKLLKLIE